jgi:hypothetical protein
LNQNDPNATVVVDKPTLDLGIVKKEQVVNFEFIIHLREQEGLEITEIKSACDCLSIEPSATMLMEGQPIRFTGKFAATKRNGHMVLPIEIVFSNGSSLKVFANVEVRN